MLNKSGFNKSFSSTLKDGGFGILKVGTQKNLFAEFWNANLDQIKYELNSSLEKH